MTLVVVLLAAGGGTRFRGTTHKLLAPLDGRPVIAHAVDHALAGDVGPVVVVTGAVSATQLFGRGVPDGVTVVDNDQWQQGQATSLLAAVRCAEVLLAGADGLLMGLGDQPFIEPDAWRAVARAAPEHQIVVASYDGRRGPHPVRLNRSLWAELPQSGDDGARTLIRKHSALVHEVPCAGSAADIDTLEDLQRWTSS